MKTLQGTGSNQILNAFDIDKDGKEEFIAIKGKQSYSFLSIWRADRACWGYHDRTSPEIFEAPEDISLAWKGRILAEIPYGEEMVPCDLDGDGRSDIVAGPYWLENRGGGTFLPHLLLEGFDSVAVSLFLI